MVMEKDLGYFTEFLLVIFYVTIDDSNSVVIDLNCVISQGSIVGLLLKEIYGFPLFNLLKLTTFADDNFIIWWNTSIEELIENIVKAVVYLK